MKTKVVSSILILLILIQIPLTQVGCTSFYPAADKDLSRYSSESRLLIRMKDKTDLDIIPANSVFVDSSAELVHLQGKEFNYETKRFSDFSGVIEKEKIDSVKFLKSSSNKYYIYWINGNRKITCEKEAYSVVPESGSNFWLVYDNNKNEMRKIYNREIEYIQIKETNWLATSFLILIGVLALTLIIFSITWEGISFGNGGSLY